MTIFVTTAGVQKSILWSTHWKKSPLSMSSNPLRSDARPLVGCTLGFGAIFSAQLIARAGYDWVLVDMEHNPLSASQATSMTHAVIAASAGRCQPLVRVPSHAVEWTKWALDSGAYGLVVPMVNSAEEARRIVQNAAYPPLGQRSFGPARAPYAHVDPATTVLKYRDEISKDVQVIAMIESIEGLRNAEEIIAVEGITAVFVGPVDLRMSMGLKGGDGTEDEYLEALKKLVRISKAHNKPIGIFADGPDSCRSRAREGFDFLLVCTNKPLEPDINTN
ncbi:hypothetical protein KCU98_g1328, partial [Aureobasidium melanogenum]